MRYDNYLNIAKSYISGFSEVRRHESFSKTLVGLLKILSYALILPPLILGCMYWKNRKIHDLQNCMDSKIDNNTIQDIFTQSVIAPENQENSQKKMMRYLVNKLVNFEKRDNEQLERARFEKGFKQLSFESQEEFFRRAQELDCLEMALNWIPKDIKELNFVSGLTNAVQNSSANKHNVLLLLEELPKFNQLTKIELNLRGLGFYTASVDKNVQTMTGPGDVFACSEDLTKIFEVGGAQYHHSNDTFPILKVVAALRKLLHKQPDLKWDMSFTGFAVGGKGVELNMVGGEGSRSISSFAINLRDYLKS